MEIKFKTLTLSNFKSHFSLLINFGDITTISGTNGAGKSSIADSITWVLYGIDSLGTKLDPTSLINRGNVVAQLLLDVDGKEILLGREIASGKNKFYVNEVPEKATKYSELVEALFDKNLFLSLFNPTYFFTQHWETQRGQLLSYVTDPTNKEVLDQLTAVHQNKLGEELKKRSLNDLDKMHRDNKNKTDKELHRLSGVLDAHENAHAVAMENAKALDATVTLDQLYEKANALQSQIDGHSALFRSQQEYDRTLIQLETQHQTKGEDMKRESDAYKALKEQEVNQTCAACGQQLTDEAVAKSHEHHAAVVQKQLEKAKGLVSLYKGIGEKLEAHKATPRPIVPDISELNQQLRQMGDRINILKAVDQTKATLDATNAKHKEVAKDHNASSFMVDYIKDFRAKRAEITAKKVAEFFTTLSVRLFNETKDGEQKPTFEIEMNGVPYSKLSTAEKIKAGLELIGVLSAQSGVVAPVFVDNAESILRFAKPLGQLMQARVQDSELNITTENLEGVAVSE